MRNGAIALCVGAAWGQNVGTLKQENHPKLTIQSCTKAGGCKDEQKAVTIDSNWRWTHSTSGTTNCYTGNKWDETLCPDAATCAKNCAIEGADEEYESEGLGDRRKIGDELLSPLLSLGQLDS